MKTAYEAALERTTHIPPEDPYERARLYNEARLAKMTPLEIWIEGNVYSDECEAMENANYPDGLFCIHQVQQIWDGALEAAAKMLEGEWAYEKAHSPSSLIRELKSKK